MLELREKDGAIRELPKRAYTEYRRNKYSTMKHKENTERNLEGMPNTSKNSTVHNNGLQNSIPCAYKLYVEILHIQVWNNNCAPHGTRRGEIQTIDFRTM
jgi:hypothetical protein